MDDISEASLLSQDEFKLPPPDSSSNEDTDEESSSESKSLISDNSECVDEVLMVVNSLPSTQDVAIMWRFLLISLVS